MMYQNRKDAKYKKVEKTQKKRNSESYSRLMGWTMPVMSQPNQKNKLFPHKDDSWRQGRRNLQQLPHHKGAEETLNLYQEVFHQAYD